MGHTPSVGRVGGLAFALGLGTAVLIGGGCPEAAADTESGSQTATSARSASDSASRSAAPGPRRHRATARPAASLRADTPEAPALTAPAGTPVRAPAAPSRARPHRDRAALPDRVPAQGAAAAVAQDLPTAPEPRSAPVVDVPAGGPITVVAVDYAPGKGLINGVIEAVSARGLPVSYSLAAAPDQGGEVNLESTGAFTLTPRLTAAEAGTIETFGVLITEKTPLERFLAQLPFMGALVPQIFMALRQTPIVGEVLAPLIGSSTVKQISVDISVLNIPDPPPPVVRVGAGWNIYSWQASSAPVLEAIDRQKPGLVRWFVEMDRFLEDETQPFWPSRPWSWNADTSFDPFFQTLADNDTTLIISLWNKDHWAKSMRACDTCSWPLVEQFGAFARDLDAEADKFGVQVIFEPFNEPDLRWGSLNAATNIGATENFTGQWFVGLPQGFAKYTGGTGYVWQQMHQVIDAPLASGGIISLYTAEVDLADRLTGNFPTTSTSTQWIDATAPLVDYTSFHHYGLTSVADYVDWVHAEWSIWSARKGFPVPFYIGEIGPTPTGTVGFTDAEAAMMRGIHQALASDTRFAGSYLGMTAHVFSSTGAANPWETAKGWWDPAFTVSDVAGPATNAQAG